MDLCCFCSQWIKCPTNNTKNMFILFFISYFTILTQIFYPCIIIIGVKCTGAKYQELLIPLFKNSNIALIYSWILRLTKTSWLRYRNESVGKYGIHYFLSCKAQFPLHSFGILYLSCYRMCDLLILTFELEDVCGI